MGLAAQRAWCRGCPVQRRKRPELPARIGCVCDSPSSLHGLHRPGVARDYSTWGAARRQQGSVTVASFAPPGLGKIVTLIGSHGLRHGLKSIGPPGLECVSTLAGAEGIVTRTESHGLRHGLRSFGPPGLGQKAKSIKIRLTYTGCLYFFGKSCGLISQAAVLNCAPRSPRQGAREFSPWRKPWGSKPRGTNQPRRGDRIHSQMYRASYSTPFFLRKVMNSS